MLKFPTPTRNYESLLWNRSVSPAKRAADILKAGGVIAVPTDTIYGLAALVQNAGAVQKLYDIKGRDDAKPIAICVAEVADLGVWGEVDEGVDGVLGDLLPGPVTILLRRKERLNAEFNPATRLVGIRDTIECSRQISVNSTNTLEPA